MIRFSPILPRVDAQQTTISKPLFSGRSQKVIKFYHPQDPDGHFSNFSRHAIVLDGKHWPTVEHYYQAQKYVGIDETYAEAIRKVGTPGEAKSMSRDPKHPPNPNWDLIKDDIMRRAIWAKFTQHPSLKQLLLDTGNAILVEDSPKDYHWGCGKDGTGINMLGKILVETREKLRQQTTP